MKKNRLYKGLAAFVMLLFVSVNAIAQEFTLKNITFLTPGQKGVIAVGMKNNVNIKAFQGRLILPEGLSFVETETTDLYKISTTERTKDFDVALKKTNDHSATMLAFTTHGVVAPGEGDVYTVEVNVSENFKGTKELKLTMGEMASSEEEFAPADLTAKVISSDNQILTSVNDVKVKEGVASKVVLSIDFQKTLLNVARFDIVLPEGLSIVEGSAQVNPVLCTNHVANITDKNVFVIDYKSIFGNKLTFEDKAGELCSFEVIADEKFVDGSEIVLKDINGAGIAPGDKDASNFYAEDVHIKVTKDNTATGINSINADDFASKADGIYTISGLKVDKLVKGINIVVKDGKATKVVKK